MSAPAIAEGRPAPTFTVAYRRTGQESAERFEMLAPPVFVPGFVIFTMLNGTQVAYPAHIFADIAWSVKS